MLGCDTRLENGKEACLYGGLRRCLAAGGESADTTNRVKSQVVFFGRTELYESRCDASCDDRFGGVVVRDYAVEGFQGIGEESGGFVGSIFDEFDQNRYHLSRLET